MKRIANTGFNNRRVNLKWSEGSRNSDQHSDRNADDASHQTRQHCCRRRCFYSETFTGN